MRGYLILYFRLLSEPDLRPAGYSRTAPKWRACRSDNKGHFPQADTASEGMNLPGMTCFALKCLTGGAGGYLVT
jgi:hypothetical protein